MSGEEQAAARVAELLRLSGHEVQLTAALGDLIAADERLAAGMLRVLLDAATESDAAPFPIPERITVDHQQRSQRSRLLGGTRRLGRVDWRFYDPADELHVVVEVKLDSRLGDNQIGRYVQDDRVRAAARGGVVMLSKDPVGRDELGGAGGDPRWLGVARWHEVLAPLAALPDELSLTQTTDRAAWQAILRQAAAAGDLGSALPGYSDLRQARRGQRAQIRNLLLLRAASDEALHELRKRLAAGRKIGDSFALKRGRGRHVQGGGEISLTIGGRDGFTAIRLGLTGSRLPLRLTAAIWPPQSPLGRRNAWVAALRALRKQGWYLSGSWLISRDIELTDGDAPPHIALADAIVATLAPAIDEPLLLQGYLARSVRVAGAKPDEVAAIVSADHKSSAQR
jgi:hypothetical protein